MLVEVVNFLYLEVGVSDLAREGLCPTLLILLIQIHKYDIWLLSQEPKLPLQNTAFVPQSSNYLSLWI